jgi:sRNA-binding protein
MLRGKAPPGNWMDRLYLNYQHKGRGMASHRIERERGLKEATRQLAVLREKWPVAFPVKDEDVRPLSIAAADEIAAAMSWSRPYTLGVLRHWKMRAAYCQAVLRHEQRIALDGAPAEPVGAEAKDLANKHLARLAAGKATTKDKKDTPPAAVEPPPASGPDQLRERVRASLLRRSA